MIKALALALFVAAITIACGITAFAGEGVSFTAEDIYKTDDPLSELPSTYEATLCLPKGMSARAGVIVGSYYGTKSTCFNFEIHKNGKPRFYLIDDSYTVYDVIFDTVNVCTDEWVHLAIVKDSAAGELHCYVNGELKETKSVSLPESVTFSRATCLGGDNRSENAQYFKGMLGSVSLYSDVRTADEIRADATGVLDTDGLIGSYDLSAKADSYADINGKGPTFNLNNPYADDYVGVTDYAYSFAVVGDTQIMTLKYPDKLSTLYDWLVGNAEEKKIKFVFGLGDITDKCTEEEWQIAHREIHKLDGVLPYSLIRGNHDRYDDCFEKYFPLSDYSDKISGSYNSTMRNTYQELVVGEIRYLIVNLDFTLPDEAIEWANRVVAEHPEHNVIVTTHIYMSASGSRIKTLKYGSLNSGQDLWEKFISKHENITLVLVGHSPSEYVKVTRSIGDHGNEVVEMLVDPQGTDGNLGGLGLVAMLYFSEDGRQVDVEYYSTVKDAYYREENQFHLELNVIGAEDGNDTPSEGGNSGGAPDGEEPLGNENADTVSAYLVVATVGAALVIAAVAVIFIRKKRKMS